MNARSALVALLLIPASLAGCAGDSLLPPGGLTADAPEAAGAPNPTTETTASAASSSGGFNPFAEQPPASAGARQVIANPTVSAIALLNAANADTNTYLIGDSPNTRVTDRDKNLDPQAQDTVAT